MHTFVSALVPLGVMFGLLAAVGVPGIVMALRHDRDVRRAAATTSMRDLRDRA